MKRKPVFTHQRAIKNVMREKPLETSMSELDIGTSRIHTRQSINTLETFTIQSTKKGQLV